LNACQPNIALLPALKISLIFGHAGLLPVAGISRRRPLWPDDLATIPGIESDGTMDFSRPRRILAGGNHPGPAYFPLW
jgi:hypothetical protein